MSYSAIVDMARSVTLRERLTAAAAKEGIDNPENWVSVRIWALAATPNWADDWAYALDTATVNVNPDTGARLDVIDDTKILAAVQALYASQTTTA